MPRPVEIHPDNGGQLQPRRLDPEVAALAARQHGVVSRAQLLELGLGRRAIDHRVERGRLHVVHRGVYAVGHRLVSREGRWLAAVLATGPDSVLSHRAAAALWGLRPGGSHRIDVTVRCKGHRRPGVAPHVRTLAEDEVTVRAAIPVTGVHRTLFDLAAILPRHQLERAMNEAERLRLRDVVSLATLVERHRGRPGTPVLRELVAAGRLGAAITRSELEARFLSLLDRRGIPRPEINVWLPALRIEVDCLWRAQRVVIELDGRGTHDTRTAFERDRARDRALQVAGYRVVRITWRQLHEDAEAVLADLRALLATGRDQPPAAAKRSATFDQSTVFHHASM